jgi:hypothetical protein
MTTLTARLDLFDRVPPAFPIRQHLSNENGVAFVILDE